jgi:hypothetical protein
MANGEGRPKSGTLRTDGGVTLSFTTSVSSGGPQLLPTGSGITPLRGPKKG